MVLTPMAIELEEIVRQAVPARKGHPEVSAGNMVGTLLYFVLFNLGLIALVAPVGVNRSTRPLDWPFLIGVTWLAALLPWWAWCLATSGLPTPGSPGWKGRGRCRPPPWPPVSTLLRPA